MGKRITSKDSKNDSGRYAENVVFDKSRLFWNGVTSVAHIQRSSKCDSSYYSTTDKPRETLIDKKEHEKVRLSSSFVKNILYATKIVQLHYFQRVVAEKWMIYPSDPRKIAWDCLSCAAVLYAVAEIPFTIGFLSDVREDFAIVLTDDILVLIFGIEIFLTFNSAVVDTSTGLLITNRKEIAAHYSKFWLWIDIAAAAPIRQLAIVFYSHASADNLDSLKLLRLLRLSRLAYVYKLLNSQRLSAYMDYINFSPQIKNMTLLFLQIFLTGHVVACFWFFITTRSCTGLENPSDDNMPILIQTWATEFGFQTMNTYGRYIGSLYWTFETLFTIGYGDIHAVNDGERVFSILIMLLGSIIFGAIIAKIKDVLDSCSIQSNETIVKIEEFSEYLEEKNFPKILRVRAKKAYVFYLERRPSLAEKGLFNILPRALTIKVLNLKYRTELASIELFRTSDLAFVTQLLLYSKPYFMRCGETIYGLGDVSDELTFILRGSVCLTVPDDKRAWKAPFKPMGYATSGGYFGDFEYAKSSARMAQYTALQNSSLLSVSYARLSEAIKDCPVAGAIFLEQMKVRTSSFISQVKKSSVFANPKEHSSGTLLGRPLSFTDTSLADLGLPRSPGFRWGRSRSLSGVRSGNNSMANMNVGEMMWVDGVMTSLETVEREISDVTASCTDIKWMLVKEVVLTDGSVKEEVVNCRVEDLRGAGILMPKDRLKLTWDAFIGMMIIYSILSLPLLLAFESYTEGPNGRHMLSFDYVIMGLFFVDILATLNTAYYSEKHDAYITARNHIARHYVQSWLVVDLLSCIPFDVIVDAALRISDQKDRLHTIQLIKVLRLLRLAKIFKLSNSRRSMAHFIESLHINSAAISMVFMITTIAVIGHFMACVWWGASARLSDSPWFNNDGRDLRNVPFEQQYVMAMYLSIATLTSTGYGDVHPVNNNERLLAIFIFIAGAIVYGYVTANVALILSNMGRSNARSDRFTHQIKEFLDSDEISNKFMWEVIGHAKKVLKRSSVHDEEQILERLPLHMRMELLLYDNRMVLESLLPFHYIQNDSVKLEILRSMKSNYAEKGRCIMKQGETGGGMVFLLSGRAVISREKVWRKPWVAKRDTSVRFKSSKSTYAPPVQSQGRSAGTPYGSRSRFVGYGVGADGSRGQGQGEVEGSRKYHSAGIRSTMTRIFRLNGDGSQDSLESVHSARQASTPGQGRGIGLGQGQGEALIQGHSMLGVVVEGSTYTDKGNQITVQEGAHRQGVWREFNDLSAVAGDCSGDARSASSATTERMIPFREVSVREMTLKQPSVDSESHGLPGIPGVLDGKDSDCTEDYFVGDNVKGWSGKEDGVGGTMRGEGEGGEEGEGELTDAIPISNISIVMDGPHRDTSTLSLPLSSLSSSSSPRPIPYRNPSTDSSASVLSTPTPSPASSQRLKYANCSIGGSMSNLFNRKKNNSMVNLRENSVTDIKPTLSDYSHIRNEKEQDNEMKRINKDKGVINDVESKGNGVIKVSKRQSFLAGVGKYVYQAVDKDGAKSKSDELGGTKQEVLGILRKGDFIGHHEVRNLSKFSFSLTASEACWYYTLDHADLLTSMRNNPRVALEFQRALGLSIEEMDKRLITKCKQQGWVDFFTDIREDHKKCKKTNGDKKWIGDKKWNDKKWKDKKWNGKNGGFSTMLMQYKSGKMKTRLDDVTRFNNPKECSPKDGVSVKSENALFESEEYMRSLRKISISSSNEDNKGSGSDKEGKGETKDIIDEKRETKESEEEEEEGKENDEEIERERERDKDKSQDVTEETMGITGIEIGSLAASEGTQVVDRSTSSGRFKRGRLGSLFSLPDRRLPSPSPSSNMLSPVGMDSPTSRSVTSRRSDRTGGSNKTNATLDRFDRMQRMYLEDDSNHRKGKGLGMEQGARGSVQGHDTGGGVGESGSASATISAKRGYTLRSFSSHLRSSTKSQPPPSSSSSIYPFSSPSSLSPTDRGSAARNLHLPFPHNIFKKARRNKTESGITNENEIGISNGRMGPTSRGLPFSSSSSSSALNRDTTQNTHNEQNVRHNNAHSQSQSSPSTATLRYDASSTPGAVRSRESRIFIKANRSSADLLSVHEIGLDHYQDCRTVLKRSLSHS